MRRRPRLRPPTTGPIARARRGRRRADPRPRVRPSRFRSVVVADEGRPGFDRLQVGRAPFDRHAARHRLPRTPTDPVVRDPGRVHRRPVGALLEVVVRDQQLRVRRTGLAGRDRVAITEVPGVGVTPRSAGPPAARVSRTRPVERALLVKKLVSKFTSVARPEVGSRTRRVGAGSDGTPSAISPSVTARGPDRPRYTAYLVRVSPLPAAPPLRGPDVPREAEVPHRSPVQYASKPVLREGADSMVVMTAHWTCGSVLSTSPQWSPRRRGLHPPKRRSRGSSGCRVGPIASHQRHCAYHPTRSHDSSSRPSMRPELRKLDNATCLGPLGTPDLVTSPGRGRMLLRSGYYSPATVAD